MFRKVFIILMVLSAITTLFFMGKEKQYRHDETVRIPSEGDSITVKISYPEEWTRKSKIIVWNNTPTDYHFLPDTIKENRDIWLLPLLRNALLDSGYVHIEYIGRNDSVTYVGRKYIISDADTRAVDLESLLNYLKAVNRFKRKKYILVGYSEGGDISSKVAGKRPKDIHAMLQLACSAQTGKETFEYQMEKIGYPTLLMYATAGDSIFIKALNKFSSLDSYHTADLEGIKQYVRENFLTVNDIIYRFDDMDSVFYHVDLYLRDRWGKEGKETKDFFANNFESYYGAFASDGVTPQQITLKKNVPDKYYRLIKCPVLAVHGTDDDRVDCYPNTGRMEQLLKEGGNRQFRKMILEGYQHNLAKPVKGGGGYFVEDSVVQEIVRWVDEQ